MANFKRTQEKERAIKPMLNHEGALVHELNDIEVLFSQTLGSFFGESTYYEDRDANTGFIDLYERIQRVPERDKEYVLKIAELGRLCNMIEYPLQIFVAACNTDMFTGNGFIDEKTGRNKLQTYAPRLIRRAKDVTGVVSTQFAIPEMFEGVKKGLPMQLKKAVKTRLESFDMFQLSKGLSKRASVTLADCINLTHPKPRNKEYEQFFKDILDGKVKAGNDKVTLNTALTQKGQEKSDDNTDVIRAVNTENIMNIVKNLVTLHRSGVFDDKGVLDGVCNRLMDADEVRKSKLLPFRFLSAYDMLDNKFGNRNATVISLKAALRKALELSVSNVPALDGTTCVLVDISGSMSGSTVSQKSTVTLMSAASVLGAIAYKCGKGDLFAFSGELMRVNISDEAPVMDIAAAIVQAGGHGGTDLKKALQGIEEHAEKTGTKYDNLIILSDNDCYGYDNKTNTLIFGEPYFSLWSRSVETADKHINNMLQKGIIRKAWINNLGGNDFAIFNTNQHTKNLVTGYSEKFIELINTYNALGVSDIRKVIDEMLERKRKSQR